MSHSAIFKNKFDKLPLYILKLGFCATISYFIQRLFLGKGKLIQLRLPGFTNKIYLRNKSFDTNIFFQIFIKEELGFVNSLNFPIESIIDAGANVGLSSIYLKKRFPTATLISIEPA